MHILLPTVFCTEIKIDGWMYQQKWYNCLSKYAKICCSGSTGKKFTDLCELQWVPNPNIQLLPGLAETVEIWVLWVMLWRSLIYYLIISHSDCTESSNQIRWFPVLRWPALCSHTPFSVPGIIQPQGESNRLSNLRITLLLCSLSF